MKIFYGIVSCGLIAILGCSVFASDLYFSKKYMDNYDYFVVGENTTLKEKPDKESKKITDLPIGFKVKIKSDKNMESNAKWFYVGYQKEDKNFVLQDYFGWVEKVNLLCECFSINDIEFEKITSIQIVPSKFKWNYAMEDEGQAVVNINENGSIDVIFDQKGQLDKGRKNEYGQLYKYNNIYIAHTETRNYYFFIDIKKNYLVLIDNVNYQVTPNKFKLLKMPKSNK